MKNDISPPQVQVGSRTTKTFGKVEFRPCFRSTCSNEWFLISRVLLREHPLLREPPSQIKAGYFCPVMKGSISTIDRNSASMLAHFTYNAASDTWHIHLMWEWAPEPVPIMPFGCSSLGTDFYGKSVPWVGGSAQLWAAVLQGQQVVSRLPTGSNKTKSKGTAAVKCVQKSLLFVQPDNSVRTRPPSKCSIYKDTAGKKLRKVRF